MACWFPGSGWLAVSTILGAVVASAVATSLTRDYYRWREATGILLAAVEYSGIYSSIKN